MGCGASRQQQEQLQMLQSQLEQLQQQQQQEQPPADGNAPSRTPLSEKVKLAAAQAVKDAVVDNVLQPAADAACSSLLSPGGQVLDAQAAAGSAEEAVSRAVQEREAELQGFCTEAFDAAQSGDLEDLGAISVQLFTFFAKAVRAVDEQERGVGREDIASLSLQAPSTAESRFRRCSAVGRVLVSGAQSALEAVPFGAPVGAVIGVIFARAAQAAHNATAAQRLLHYLKAVDSRLARLLVAKSRGRVGKELAAPMEQLGHKLDTAARLMFAYSGRGFLVRMLMSSSDKDGFAQVERDIRVIMEDITQEQMLVEIEAKDATQELPDSQALRKELCALAGQPLGDGPWDEKQAEKVLGDLQQRKPDALRELLRKSARLEDKVIQAELSALAARVAKLERSMSLVQHKVAKIEEVLWSRFGSVLAHEKAMGPVSLNAVLKEWWDKQFKMEILLRGIGWEHLAIPCESFVGKLKASIHDNIPDGKAALQLYDAVLGKLLSELGTAPPAVGKGDSDAFLNLVLIPELDENVDGQVTCDELLSLQMKAEHYAKFVFKDDAKRILHGWLDLLEAIFMGFDRQSLVHVAPKSLLLSLDQKMKVKHLIQSYKLPSLVSQYVAGTRTWLSKEINEWLATSITSVDDKASRMFLLLAGPGMGKSVFSAVIHTHLMAQPSQQKHVKTVKHFFKVGEERSQARAMVLSLAYQVAEQLPGFAELLEPVADELGSGTEVPLEDLFKRYLMDPLETWGNAWDDKNAAQGGTGCAVKPILVMLVDALDEADHNNRGCLPVASLLAKQFHALPTFVKVILTARKQIGERDTTDVFAAWQPKLISPDAEENTKDMETLLTLRFGAPDSQVAPVERREAVRVLTRKSKGEFIYAAYALYCMRLLKDGNWTALELEDRMPDGLGGAYALIMMAMTSALRREKPELLRLLVDSVIPVLVAAREPLSPALIAWACGDPSWRSGASRSDLAAQVDELLQNGLAKLFPTRPSPGGGLVVQPYHKSVLDWLMGQEGMDAGEFRVDPRRGHQLLGSRGEEYCRLELEAQPGKDVETAQCNLYALRHTLAHLCLAGSVPNTGGATATAPALLDRLVLNFGFWQHAYTASIGPLVARDLLGLAATTPAVMDVARWLRACSALLTEYPQATAQLAVDAPSNSKVALAAGPAFTRRVSARLMTKETDWPPLIATFLGHRNNVQSVAISPDGKTIVSSSWDRTVRVWDAFTGEQKSMLEGHTDDVTSVAISPDGKTIVSSSDDETVRVWDALTGDQKSVLEHTSRVNSVAISPDGKAIVSGSAEAVHVWDAPTGEKKSVFEGHTDTVYSVAISTDGKSIVSGSRDGSVRVWDSLTGEQKSVMEGHFAGITSVAISPDGKAIVSGSWDKTVRVWDALTGEQKSVLEGHTGVVGSVAISPDGKTIVSSSFDETVRVWDALTGEQKSVLEGHTGAVSSVAISPDGKTIVSGSSDYTVRVWVAPTAEQKRDPEGHTDRVSILAISNDGKTIVSGSEDGTVRVWDASTAEQQRLMEGHTEGEQVTSLVISPDGKTIVSGSYDETVRVWDALTGEQKSVMEGHTQVVTTLAISPDGKTIVSGSEDKTVRVWDALTGEQKSVLEGHINHVTSVAISPDGKTIVSGSRDDTVRVWGLEDGQAKEVIHALTSAEKCTAMLDTASSWQSRPTPLVPRFSADSRQVVEVVSSSSKKLVTTVYITPGHQLSADTQILSTTTRLAAITKRKQLLCYELNTSS